MKTNRKKRFAFFRQVAAAFIALAAVFLLAGCQQNIETPAEKDTTPPAEVTALTAQAGSGKIALSWKNPADDDLYQVEITAFPAHGSLKYAVCLAAEKGKEANYIAEGLTNGTAYTFTIKTIDKSLNKSAGKTTESAVTPVSTSDTTPPAEVTVLTAQAGRGKIALSWKNPADDDLYQVEITANPAHGSLKTAVYLAAEKGKDASYTAEDLTDNTAYTFTVKTIDKSLNKSAGKTTESPVIPLSTSDTTPPAEVANFTATPGSSSIINLSWKNPADDDLYQVEITALPAHGSLKTAIYLAAERGKVVSYNADGLNADTEYTFTVKTVDKSLNKSAGLSKTARTQKASLPSVPMVVTLTQSPATPTNGAVTVSVSSSTSVKTAKWSAGIKTVDEVLASGTLISGGSFTVSGNGTYTVAVMDTDGRREIKTITVNNIDKTPPAKVQNLSAVYSSVGQKITVTWTNPADADFAGSVLRWKKGAGSETEVLRSKTDTSYEITGISPDNSEYTISLTAKDELGNESEKENVTLRSTLNAEVTAISLDRTHLDTIMTNRSVAVTVTGSNFNTLSSLLVQVTDGYTAQPPVTATIDAAHNKATATVTALVPASPTEAGTVYTVKAIVNGTPAQATANFTVSAPAAVKEIILSPAQIKFGSASSVSVRVKGANFDIRGETKIKLLNSAGQEVSASTVTVPPSIGNASEFTVSVPLPSESGFYTVALYFGGKKDAETADVQLYDDPVITSIAIPRAGISYAGNTLPVTITGKNFKAPGISAADFSGTGATFSNFKIISDTKATAKVFCPYTAGEHAITINCKTASQTGTISVKDYSLWTPGKIILSNNTVVDKDGYMAIDPATPPVAVVCGTNSYGVAIGIALHTGTHLEWAKDGTTGYKTYLTGIVCTPSVWGVGAAADPTLTFTDTDGSDNWDYICSVDPEGTANAAVNYPAFDWVKKYNITYASKLGAARPAWYMPSIAELCEVYKNKDAVNASFLKINGLNSAYADSNLGTDSFWSSSQHSVFDNNAWLAGFGSGYLYSDHKDYNSNVCCIAGF